MELSKALIEEATTKYLNEKKVDVTHAESFKAGVDWAYKYLIVPKENMTNAEYAQAVKDTVYRITGVDMDTASFKTRERRNIIIRAVAAKYLRIKGLTLQEIGFIIRKSHCTVVYILDKYDDEYRYNREFKIMADRIFDELKINNKY